MQSLVRRRQAQKKLLDLLDEASLQEEGEQYEEPDETEDINVSSEVADATPATPEMTDGAGVASKVQKYEQRIHATSQAKRRPLGEKEPATSTSTKGEEEALLATPTTTVEETTTTDGSLQVRWLPRDQGRKERLHARCLESDMCSIDPLRLKTVRETAH